MSVLLDPYREFMLILNVWIRSCVTVYCSFRYYRSSETSSNSPMDGLASNVGASPVSSAVRSLTNLSDFSLDVSNGNYDNYGGITDSLLSAEASKDVKVETTNATSHSGGQQRGPLLDFKSAFSDLDSKPSDLRLISILKSRPVHL